jgi:hypothetical protein
MASRNDHYMVFFGFDTYSVPDAVKYRYGRKKFNIRGIAQLNVFRIRNRTVLVLLDPGSVLGMRIDPHKKRPDPNPH